MHFRKLKESANALADKAATRAKEVSDSASQFVAEKGKFTADKVADMSDRAAKAVVEKSDDLAKAFSESGMWDKIKNVAKQAGITVIYPVLVLFELTKSPDVPIEKKAIIFGALGYFILPVDLIPDVVPGVGFADDAAALTTCLKMVLENITEPLTKSVKLQLHTWFGDFEEKSLESVDRIIKMGDSTMKFLKR